MVIESCSLIVMTRRMQVLFDDEEYRGIQRIARECHMTVAEWVRQCLREARLARQSIVDTKLRAVDEATGHRLPCPWRTCGVILTHRLFAVSPRSVRSPPSPQIP